MVKNKWVLCYFCLFFGYFRKRQSIYLQSSLNEFVLLKPKGFKINLDIV